MRTIIYLILVFLLLNSVAKAQDYSTNYTRVASQEGEEIVPEVTMFFYTDSTLEIISPHIMQKFTLERQIHGSMFLLKDPEGLCATVEYFLYKRKRFLKKPIKTKFITLTYNSKYTFFFDNPSQLY